MPAGLGYLDANGIWRYGESDTAATASDLLNLGQASASNALAAARARLVALERKGSAVLTCAKTTTHNTVVNIGSTSPDHAWTETQDALNWHNPTTNPTRITPTFSGRYLVILAVAWGGSASGVRYGWLGRNGAFPSYWRSLQSAGNDSFGVTTVTADVSMNGTTDYLEARAFQSSGGNLALDALMTVRYLGPA
jgi:hypothetical protein